MPLVLSLKNPAVGWAEAQGWMKGMKPDSAHRTLGTPAPFPTLLLEYQMAGSRSEVSLLQQRRQGHGTVSNQQLARPPVHTEVSQLVAIFALNMNDRN